MDVDDGSGSITIGQGVPDLPLDRTRAPEVGPVPTLRLPARTVFQLENGIDVVLVRQARLPIVDIQLQFDGGASLPTSGPGGASGLAALVADMLDEGTTSRSAVELADQVDQLGASLASTASRDAAAVRLTVLKPRLESALELMADVVLNPAFADDDLERVREQRRVRAVQQRDQPGVQAGYALDEALFGAAHPYGQPLLGTPESLVQIGREEVIAHFRAQYRPSRVTVIAVGDIREAELRPLLEQHFGGWNDGEAPEGVESAAAPRSATPVPERPARTVYILDRPGAAQSEIRVGRVAVDRATEDFFPLMVLNTILGGAFTSRLNLVLREEKGYTYGAGSGFAMRKSPGPFVASSAVHTPVTDSAVVDFIREIERMSEETVPAEELERAKNYVALRLADQFETTGDIGDRMAEVALHSLPDGYYSRYRDGVMAVTARDVQRAARAHLDPARMVIVVVGDRAAIEEPLRRLAIGEVVILEKP